MSVRDRVIEAFERADEVAVRRLGWFEAWEAAATWWKPRQTCNAHDFVPYAKLLGGEDPALVVDAFRALAGDWRPSPAAVLAQVRAKRGESKADPGRVRNPAESPRALSAVEDAVRSGERACECGCPTSRTWRADGAGVWRCPDCCGLAEFQVYAVEDLRRAA